MDLWFGVLVSGDINGFYKSAEARGQMSPMLIGMLCLILFFILLVFGLPVGASMVFVALIGMTQILPPSTAFYNGGMIAYNTVADYGLAVMPMFLFMAELVFRTGLSGELYNVASKWLGHYPGGLAMATVGGCGVMAAVASSSLSCAAPMALVALPEMKKYRYSPALASGSIAAGGTMGILIPPSGMLIIYGILTEQSIAKLFAGGFIPGILEAVFYCATIFIICKLNPLAGPRGPKFKIKDRIKAFGGAAEIIGVILVCLGGLFLGWFTPTEAGAAGAFGALFFSTLRGRLTWVSFKEALTGTMKLTGMLYGVIIGANIFKTFMALTNIPIWLADFVAALPVPPLVIMAAIILVYFILGCFMDSAAMILLTIPIFFPIAENLGFHPIWFGIILMRVMEIGLITPPLGMIVFTIAQMADIPVTTVFRGVLPFVISDLCHVALLLFIPEVVLYLPRIIAG
jgi:C4-dicarboxylate transporter DctM subunit